MKPTIIISLLFALSGCASTAPDLIRTQYKVVMPNFTAFTCPSAPALPNVETLSDVQVARLLVKLYKNNVQCKRSLDALEEFLLKADKKVN